MKHCLQQTLKRLQLFILFKPETFVQLKLQKNIFTNKY